MRPGRLLETRALAIAFFFAIGTAAGGIAGPELFGQLIHSGNADLVGLGFLIGAAAMSLGGVAELFLGVRAEQQSLESIARPLTAEEADAAEGEFVPADAVDHEREQRVRHRTDARRERQRHGMRRYRPGPGTSLSSPGMIGTAGTASRSSPTGDVDVDREIVTIARALDAHGPLERAELARLVDARGWGPGRFRAALRVAVVERGAVRLPDGAYGPPVRSASPREPTSSAD